MTKRFDQKFGANFIQQIPDQPGSYRVYSAQGALFYVGKATSLRKRISQYRNAGPKKEHSRMRRIVKEATRWEWQTTATLQEAELLELQWIQEHRPKFNLTSSFSRIYPYFALRSDGGRLWLIFSHRQEVFSEAYTVFGAWRSRTLALEAFEALGSLLALIAQPMPRKDLYGKKALLSAGLERSARAFGFRDIDPQWLKLLEEFFLGQSSEALGEIALELLNSNAARERPAWVERQLKAIRAFYREEARPLAKARKELNISVWPIPQTMRDELTIRLRHKDTLDPSQSIHHE